MKRSLLASSVLVLAACGGGADQERPSIRVPLAASMVVFSDTSVRVDRWDLSLDLTFDGSGEVSGTCSVQPLEYICDRTDGNPCSSTGFFGSQGNVAGSRIGDALDLTLSLPPFQWTETAGAPPAPTTIQVHLTGADGAASGFLLQGTATVQGTLSGTFAVFANRPLYH